MKYGDAEFFALKEKTEIELSRKTARVYFDGIYIGQVDCLDKYFKATSNFYIERNWGTLFCAVDWLLCMHLNIYFDAYSHAPKQVKQKYVATVTVSV